MPTSLDGNTQLSVAVGITLGLIASFVQSLGLTIQRKSHVLNQQLPESDRRVEHKRPLWLLGFGIFISSNILGSLFQIASLPVVILAPLGAVSLLWNAFFARLLLGDVFSPWMFLGTVLIAGGAVLIAVFGIVPEPNHSLDDLLRLFERTAFIVYFSLLGTAVLICLVITHITDYSLSRRLVTPPISPPMSPGHISPTIASLTQPPIISREASERTPLIDRKPSPTRSYASSFNIDLSIPRSRLLLAISYASVSGILSGMCLIFAKSGVELLILTIGGKNQFWRWETWLLLVGLGIFALLQLWYLHKSLVFADPTIVCPLAFCFYNVSSIVNGLVYFNQFSALSALHLWLVSLGMLVLLGGVWVVSFHAGGGRVDVGTWQEGDDHIAEEEEIRNAHMQRHLITEPFSPCRLEAGVPQSSLPPVFSSPPVQVLSPPLSPLSLSTEGDSLIYDDHLVQSLLSPTLTRKSSRRHRYSILQQSEGSTSSGMAAPSLGGLSIGLSPISPGFAIVPKRRTGALRAVVQRATMRRTVSESDVQSHSEQEVDEEDVHHEDDRQASNGGHYNNLNSNLAGARAPTRYIRAKGRWKWLRQVFLGGH